MVHEAEQALAVTLAKYEQGHLNQEGQQRAHKAGVAICTGEIIGAKVCDCGHDKVSSLVRIEEAGPSNGKQEEEVEDGSEPHALEAHG